MTNTGKLERREPLQEQGTMALAADAPSEGERVEPAHGTVLGCPRLSDTSWEGGGHSWSISDEEVGFHIKPHQTMETSPS